LILRLGHNKTIGAIAHRLCQLIWIILHKGIRYEERGSVVREKSKTVVITLISGDQTSDEVSLDFAKDFRIADDSAYTLRSELVLNANSK